MINKNPLEILKKDHDKLKILLIDYKSAGSEKESLAAQISEELSLHMEMEEEIFYPNVEKISDQAKDLIQEAIREHNEVKAHLEEIEDALSDEPERDAHLEEMERGLLHHIEEEEDKIFPLAQKEIGHEFPAMLDEMIDFREENGMEA